MQVEQGGGRFALDIPAHKPIQQMQLLAFFGQHEHRKLTISSAQLEVLDGFAGPEHLETRRRYRDAYREHGRLAAELAETRASCEAAANLFQGQASWQSSQP